MNTIDPFPTQLLESDMSHSVAVGLTLFFGAALGGYYLADAVTKRWNSIEKRVDELESSVHDTEKLEEENSENLREMETRIREKQDYDESDEIEEKKSQGWKGIYNQEGRQVVVTLWQEKECTVKQNQEWVAWNGEANASTVVRDFYLGNLHPEFLWSLDESDVSLVASVDDTFVNGWDSVIKLKIYMAFTSKKSLLEFVEAAHWNGNPTLNSALAKIVESGSINWNRILID
jgi:hypothetical protein